MGLAVYPAITRTGSIEISWEIVLPASSNISDSAGGTAGFYHANLARGSAGTRFPLIWEFLVGHSLVYPGTGAVLETRSHITFSGMGASFSSGLLTGAGSSLSGTVTVEAELELAWEGSALYWRPIPGTDVVFTHTSGLAGLEFTITATVIEGFSPEFDDDLDWGIGGILVGSCSAQGHSEGGPGEVDPDPDPEDPDPPDPPDPETPVYAMLAASFTVDGTVDGHVLAAPDFEGTWTSTDAMYPGSGLWESVTGIHGEVLCSRGGVNCELVHYKPRNFELRAKGWHVDYVDDSDITFPRTRHITPNPYGEDGTPPASETFPGPTATINETQVWDKGTAIVGSLSISGYTTTGQVRWNQEFFYRLGLTGGGQSFALLGKAYPSAVDVTLDYSATRTVTLNHTGGGSYEILPATGYDSRSYAYMKIRVRHTLPSVSFIIDEGAPPRPYELAIGHYGDTWRKDRLGNPLVTSATPNTWTEHIIDLLHPTFNYRKKFGGPLIPPDGMWPPPPVDVGGPFLGTRPLDELSIHVTPAHIPPTSVLEVDYIQWIRETEASLFVYPTAGSSMRVFSDGGLSEAPITTIPGYDAWGITWNTYALHSPPVGGIAGSNGITYEVGEWVDWLSTPLPMGTTVGVTRQNGGYGAIDWPGDLGDVWGLTDPAESWTGGIVFAAYTNRRSVCVGAVWDQNCVRAGGASVRIVNDSTAEIYGDPTSGGLGMIYSAVPFIPWDTLCRYELPSVGFDTHTIFHTTGALNPTPHKVIFCGFTGFLLPNVGGEGISHIYDYADRIHVAHITNDDVMLLRVHQKTSGDVGSYPDVSVTYNDVVDNTQDYGQVQLLELSGNVELRHGHGGLIITTIKLSDSSPKLFISSNWGETWKMESIPGTYSSHTTTIKENQLIFFGWRSGNWHVRVGTPKNAIGAAGTDWYDWSDEEVVVATTNDNASANVRGDGTVSLVYRDSAGAMKLIQCEHLAIDGTGTWV